MVSNRFNFYRVSFSEPEYEPPAIVDESTAPHIPALVHQCVMRVHHHAPLAARYLQLRRRIQLYERSRREQ
jgi:hypothetical protein